MSRTVIKVENLAKQYRLGQIGTGSIKHDINRWWHTVRGMEDPYLKIGDENDRTKKGGSDYVWALRDLNFDVMQGEVLGIIGRNGAGKSTLLKILSRTTVPTTGSIKIKGRVASLLEVGTGFHPELTGRQNIFLNGAILGMSKSEISSKFDEIVDFSGVERYVDTPVKRYSSGMYVRLAFAVAAHLEPEILIVDEVLSVGDIEFQKKALGKMKNISAMEGRTVIFVSHNIRAILNLCSKGIVLNDGLLNFNGGVNEAVRYYCEGQKNVSNEGIFYFDEPENDAIKFIRANLENSAGNTVSSFTSRDKAFFRLLFEVKNSMKGARIGIQLESQDGVIVFTSTNAPLMGLGISSGVFTTKCEIPVDILNDGNYTIRVFAGIPNQSLVLLKPIEILQFSHQYLESRGTLISEKWQGAIIPSLTWEISE